MTIPFVYATGTPYEVGFQHGAARGDQLRAFLREDLTRINRLAPVPVSLRELRPVLDGYAAAIAGAAPRLSEEIDGLARGAGISREEAVLLQVRREIIGFQRVPARGDCTTYADLSAGPGGAPVLAQTVDLNGNLDDQLAVLNIGLSGSTRRALVLSFGGLLGYLGVNSDGLAIGLNLVLGGEWHPGLPPYLAIRHLLDNAGSVPDALELLSGLPLASSRSLTLCDPVTSACVELVDGQARLVGIGRVVHTNHFLHPDLVDRDALNIFARNSSRLRLETARTRLARLAASASGAGVEEHLGVLAEPPICVPDSGDIRRERTVCAVVLLPDRAEMHVRPGDPRHSDTRAFRLSAAGAGLGRRRAQANDTGTSGVPEAVR